MAQPSMPFGVFRGKRRGDWDWFVVNPEVGDVEERIRRWQESNAPSNPPAWRAVIMWLVFAVVGAAVGIGVPLLVFHAQEPGTWALFLLAGTVAGFISMIFTSELGQSAEPPADDAQIMRLNSNLTEWVRSTTPLVDVWDLNFEVARSTRLDRVHTGDADDGTESWTMEVLGDYLSELRSAQLSRVRYVAHRVGFVIPPSGFWVGDDD
jgi:hypothetical protein